MITYDLKKTNYNRPRKLNALGTLCARKRQVLHTETLSNGNNVNYSRELNLERPIKEFYFTDFKLWYVMYYRFELFKCICISVGMSISMSHALGQNFYSDSKRYNFSTKYASFIYYLLQ